MIVESLSKFCNEFHSTSFSHCENSMRCDAEKRFPLVDFNHVEQEKRKKNKSEKGNRFGRGAKNKREMRELR